MIVYCSASGEWQAGYCPDDCPADQHLIMPFARGSDEASEAVCRLLNAMRSAYDHMLDGDTGMAMSDLSGAYAKETGGEDIGY